MFHLKKNFKNGKIVSCNKKLYFFKLFPIFLAHSVILCTFACKEDKKYQLKTK